MEQWAKEFGLSAMMLVAVGVVIDRYIRAAAAWIAPMISRHFDAVQEMVRVQQAQTGQLGAITDQLTHAENEQDRRHRDLKKLAEAQLALSREILSLVRKDD